MATKELEKDWTRVIFQNVQIDGKDKDGKDVKVTSPVKWNSLNSSVEFPGLNPVTKNFAENVKGFLSVIEDNKLLAGYQGEITVISYTGKVEKKDSKYSVKEEERTQELKSTLDTLRVLSGMIAGKVTIEVIYQSPRGRKESEKNNNGFED